MAYKKKTTTEWLPAGSNKFFDELNRRGIPRYIARKAVKEYGYDNVFLWAGFEALDNTEDFSLAFVKRFPLSIY